MKTIVLAVLDGWGIGERHQGNPIAQIPTPTFDWMRANYPSFALQASGIAVGLPWGEEGNSEVGHLTLGAGKVIFQHFPRITMAIKDGSFFKNPALLAAFEHARKNNGRVHLLGLLTSGNVHASFEHLVALLKLAKMQEMPDVLLHLFSDGRDSLPREAPTLLEKLTTEMKGIAAGRVASLMGRFYAMDRDKRWERTERAWQILTTGAKIMPATDAILKETYDRDLDDEFVEPSLVGAPEDAAKLTVRAGDALIFFNFREDSALQLVQPFADPQFSAFARTPIENLKIVTMTQYQPGLTDAVAFEPQEITNPLARVLSDAGKRQLHLAESEKSAHVTYFFDGLRTEPFTQEFWAIIPSPKSFRFEEKPELAAHEIMNRLAESIEEGVYDFILVNFANPDLIAHTGNFDAALKVVALMDTLINRLSQICLKTQTPLIVTADHGNIESMLNPLTGMVETRHDPSPVPFFLIDQRFARSRTEDEIRRAEREVSGSLADVAPTILNLFGVPKPPEMSGESLLPLCR